MLISDTNIRKAACRVAGMISKAQASKGDAVLALEEEYQLAMTYAKTLQRSEEIDPIIKEVKEMIA